eukprot:CAMPEP_0206569176 /NCGR_PEP_ID=MMETSP0325_2-20121206/26282_1 /ASSEMBLY_ACC=CAM_ASM_000347 /TAXON_ID=2866 /ORGANISM="Crypthecodinium cohnii, Strain Seligo" /LENGTH=373 /DNA_ID=CAMNT_0054072715 /DNA_START=36 /DNA_END=1157 /DNA_ORIENTATION=+
MFRSGMQQVCPGLKLPTVPHLGCLGEGSQYELAKTCSAVRFMKEPHEKIPASGFDLLMRRDSVMDVEVYVVMYDMQDLRDWLYRNGLPFVVNILFQAWLFPDLLYRGEAGTTVEAAIFDMAGVFPVQDRPEGASRSFRTFPQQVWVKDKIYMCMGPDTLQVRVDRGRLVCSFWSLCIPEGEERAIVTKHVLLNETHTHISKEVGLSFHELGDASISCVLQHLQKLLVSVQNGTHRLSRLMGRCESAFEGVFVDGGSVQSGAQDAMSIWNEQLQLLDRSAGPTHQASECPAPLLSEMLRRRVYEELGRKRRRGKFPSDDEDTISLGHRAFTEPAAAKDHERAEAIHAALIGCIHDLESLCEGNAELLAVDGLTA